MEYLIAPRAEQKTVVKVLRTVGKLLGVNGNQTVAISTEQIGGRGTEHNYLEIDVAKSEPGVYDLNVIVTDLVAERTVAADAWFTVAGQK